MLSDLSSTGKSTPEGRNALEPSTCTTPGADLTRASSQSARLGNQSPGGSVRSVATQCDRLGTPSAGMVNLVRSASLKMSLSVGMMFNKSSGLLITFGSRMSVVLVSGHQPYRFPSL